jgi:hypothetical protein
VPLCPPKIPNCDLESNPGHCGGLFPNVAHLFEFEVNGMETEFENIVGYKKITYPAYMRVDYFFN